MKNIAVFGGTFNPVHIGHIEMAKAVSNLDFIDELLIIPDKIPPHKNPEFLASDEHRIAMCKLAFSGINKAKIDTREIYRGGKSYTFDTLCELKIENKNANILILIEPFLLTPIAYLIFCNIFDDLGIWVGYLAIQISLVVLAGIMLQKSITDERYSKV
jgi:cytidyltransferase-like protein